MDTQPEEIAQVVRDMLRQEREAGDLTIREHAQQLGISLPTYFRVQRGKIDKTTTALLRLAFNRTASKFPVAA